MKKRFTVPILAAVVICAFTLLMVRRGSPREIHVSLPAVHWENHDAASQAPAVLRIQGRQTGDTFRGSIFVEETGGEGLSLSPCSINLYPDQGYGHIFRGSAAGRDMAVVGIVLINEDWSSIVIFPRWEADGDWSSWSADAYSAPAEDRSQALSLTRQLAAGSDWLAEAEWE